MKNHVAKFPPNSPPFPIGENRLNANVLTDKQLAAIEMLIVGKSLAAVAEAMHIDRKTLYNWRCDSDFQLALAERRDELWASAADRLRGLLDSSLDVIEQRLHDRYDHSRFQAAATLLRLSGLQKSMVPGRG